MADPLSVLGATTGVLSLIIQVTDECIKGYKLFSEASNMPTTYRYLRVRLQIEQQRFLNFSMEGELLYADGQICATLQVNQNLLLAALKEMKNLFNQYSSANGKYIRNVPQGDINWADSGEPTPDLITMLCISNTHEETNRVGMIEDKDSFARPRGFSKFTRSLAQTGRKLRAVVMDPKRLVWVCVDKDNYESLISRLADINSFLTTLLDGLHIRRLHEATNKSHLEILQLQNDMRGLKELIKALEQRERSEKLEEWSGLSRNKDLLLKKVRQEGDTEEKKKQYLKRLAVSHYNVIVVI
ncbi:prion-inhibition and propagation-domain-containing protein [Amylocarpus encephaloides]|uniref:Prion-inhibition and propagation-domain-containing protein n=1 Tax=Amylocarpus encephaloides TaxID=45428 RepID=A0A9P7YRW8_9HELO|nr:prion-inhibition and propagation-domain-containing protein [Amylocarpus encephaloides]